MYNKLLCGTISSRGKEAVRRLSHRLSSKPPATPFLQTRTVVVRPKHDHILRNEFPLKKSAFYTDFITNSRGFSTHSSVIVSGLVALVPTISLLALLQFTRRKLCVKAGDPRLFEPVREVYPEEIGSERIQKVIDDLFKVMRKPNTISLSAPQIGVPLQIIMLDIFPKPRLIWWIEIIMLDIFRLDLLWKLFTKKKESYEAEEKRPHHLVVIVNPKVNSLSVPGYGVLVAAERFYDVELTGLNEYRQPIKVHASGRHARALQQSLIRTLYVDKMVKPTFGTEKEYQVASC